MVPNNRFEQEPTAPRADDAGMIGAIAAWCECLHGKGLIIHALRSVADCIGAEAVALTRVSRQVGGESRVIAYDAGSGPDSLTQLNRSFARSLLGPYFDKSKPSSIWLKSMFEDDLDPSLTEFHRRRRFKELVVIPLCAENKTVDLIEFHFQTSLKPANHALLNNVADTLSQTWSNRASGLITDAFLSKQSSRKNSSPSAPILSMENPTRLSRAEYRVCLLLSRGKPIKQVQSELEICNSTLRTHLRNIYAKTNSGNQAELLYQLLSFLPMAKGAGQSAFVA